jgi:hypothetical protein
LGFYKVRIFLFIQVFLQNLSFYHLPVSVVKFLLRCLAGLGVELVDLVVDSVVFISIEFLSDSRGTSMGR